MLEKTSTRIRVRNLSPIIIMILMIIIKLLDRIKLFYSIFNIKLFYPSLRYVQILDSTFTHVTFVLLSLNVLIMSVIGLHVRNLKKKRMLSSKNVFHYARYSKPSNIVSTENFLANLKSIFSSRKCHKTSIIF